MRAPKERFDFVHEFLNRVLIGDLRAKRVLSLANGTLGGHGRGGARGLLDRAGSGDSAGIVRQVGDQTG